jgi:23S rRNA (uridine2552-2'-O)-methyltransferase
MNTPGQRDLKVRLRTGKGRTLAQKRWLERQLNDPYVTRAKREGFRSRAAYKLIEIDDKHHLLRPGAKVIDLGAAPGGWAQVAAQRVKAAEKGRVIAIDILDMEPIPNVEFLKLDFLDAKAPATMRAMLGGPADIVLSDMAANTTGHRKTDQLRIIGLVEEAAAFARDMLAPGGAFLAKVRQGGTDSDLLTLLKRNFSSVRHVKPAASRAGSSELYVLAKGFRPGGRVDQPVF